MASFFTPLSYDPAVDDAALQVQNGKNPKYLVYTNSTLSRAGLLSNWWQYIVLVLGVVGLGFPLLYWSAGFVIRKHRRYKAKRRLPEVEKKDDEKLEPSKIHAIEFESSIKSFGYWLPGDEVRDWSASLDLCIVPISKSFSCVPNMWRRASMATPANETQKAEAKLVFGLFEAQDLAKTLGTKSDYEHIGHDIKSLLESKGLSGAAVASNDSDVSTILDLLRAFAAADIKVLYIEQSQDLRLRIHPSLVTGVIFQNAAILSNGERRDFFQAASLRDSLALCEAERKIRPKLFVGFLDLWKTRPIPAVIRRSNKFAKFNDAVLYSAPETEVIRLDSGLPNQECSSAFDWLKRDDIISAQKAWIFSVPMSEHSDSDSTSAINQIEESLPGLSQDFELRPAKKESLVDCGEAIISPNFLPQAPPRSDFWHTSSQNLRMCTKGCFDLRDECFDEQYMAIIEAQLHLQRLSMLDPLPEQAYWDFCIAVGELLNIPNKYTGVISELSKELEAGTIKIYRGLDTGFSLPNNRAHFWAVSHEDDTPDQVHNITIFVSLKSPDLSGTLLHAYLAHKGVPRKEIFEFEHELAKSRDQSLPPRVQSELENSSYSELLFLLQQIRVSLSDSELLKAVTRECETLLIDEPERLTWVDAHSQKLLAGDITMHELFQMRLSAYAKVGHMQLPRLEHLEAASNKILRSLDEALYSQDFARLEHLSMPIINAYNKGSSSGSSDIIIDLYSLMFFCALRRRAFEEVYLETTDRCPLFLQQHDQAAVFAELWVVGSQCEIYFGIKPRAIGAIIYDDYREHLNQNPPPLEAWTGKDVFSAYQKSSVVNEVVDKSIADEIRSIRRDIARACSKLGEAGSLAIFCIPAIVDVCLLTFLGRGLYLTAFMSLDERIMANYALLTALLMTAGVTGWVGSTGGFYLYQYAFTNMNYFMVQRLAGGFMLAILVSICGFIAFGIEYGWYAGFIYVAYLMLLSTYLNILGVMSTMHRAGSPFLSGRLVLGQTLLIPLISPIITSFVNNHDMAIYLPILYLFLFILILQYIRLCNAWTSWPEKVHIIKESDVTSWYEKRFGSADIAIPISEKPTTRRQPAKSQVAMASGKLMELVNEYNSPTTFFSSTSKDEDQFVKKIAEGHKYVIWLLEKESNGEPLPEPYSSTWIVQTKLALTNQQQLIRGLKEHSPFLLFRNAKYDIAQNVGLFLVALLDRWVSISMTANGHVVNVYADVRARYGIAFGLLYFLTSAIALDIILQRYWGKTGRQSTDRLANILEFEQTEKSESSLEKKRWLGAIFELITVMLCLFGLMTMLVWIFVIDGNQVLLYFLYIIGYSGVIIFQLNRVFTTNIRRHVQMVFLSVAFGYIVGVILHEIPGLYYCRYNDVIALITASLTASLSTWLYSDFCDDASREVHALDEDLVNWKVYSQKLLGSDERACQLGEAALEDLQSFECRFDDESIMSVGIKATFSQALAREAVGIKSVFPDANRLLEQTLEHWKSGYTKLIVVDRDDLAASGAAGQFAVSYMKDGYLKIFVGMPSLETWKHVSEEVYEHLMTQITSEALLHESLEAAFNLSHSSAALAELLLNPEALISTRMSIQLAWSDDVDLSAIIGKSTGELLRHLSLGIAPDVEWDSTPQEVRKYVVARVLGRQYARSNIILDWATSRSVTLDLFDWKIKQCFAVRETALWRLKSSSSIRRGSSSTDCTITTVSPPVFWNEPLSHSADIHEDSFVQFFKDVYVFFYLFIQYIAIVSTAGTDCGKELWYTLRHSIFQTPVVWFVMKVWKICYWMRNTWVRLILLERDDKFRQYERFIHHGVPRTLTSVSITVGDPQRPMTGFLSKTADGLEVAVYTGIHKSIPEKKQDYSILSYNSMIHLESVAAMKLSDMEEKQIGGYQYRYDTTRSSLKYPILRSTQSGTSELVETYDEHGRIVSGDCMKNGAIFKFFFDYKASPKNSTELVRGTYISDDEAKTKYEVYWSIEPINKNQELGHWAASERVQKLVVTEYSTVHEYEWQYSHKRDPTIHMRIYDADGRLVESSQSMKPFDDKPGLLEKPLNISFQEEDLLFYHSKSAIESAISERSSSEDKNSEKRKVSHSIFAKGTVTHNPLSTTRLRAALWKQWGATTNLDACTACFLDEKILRKEPLLRRYWRLRDAAYFAKARNYLDKHLDEIVSAIEIPDNIAAKTTLMIRPSDLYVMGLSKDANHVTPKPEDAYIDTDERVAVIFTDTGCWPDAPGGVSNCRRDLVDGHTTIRNYAFTESANEYGISRFQVEKNVQATKNLPLWGLDGKSPYHGLLQNLLQSQVEHRIRNTRSKEDIKDTFIPLLRTFIRGARQLRYSKADLLEYTQVVLKINYYFEDNDYLTTWRSKAVKKAWREAWLAEYRDPNIKDPNEAFLIERPTARDFDEAMELYISYFFIFSVRVPEKVPRVFQSTHHGISSLYGMILKLRRGTTWGIWDHAIMWRESCLNISPAQCILPISVQSMLLGAMKLASHLAYTHADVILPCTAIYNPIWEAELGTDQGLRSSQKVYQRKIDPITNGISNMEQFKPVEITRTKDPTVVMLSNVQFIKDVKNAIQAAGVIINEFGFKDYNLVVYGAQDRQPSYAIETEAMIGNLGIAKTVKLGGFGSPKEVLKDAWLFMNSSLSEGLPLAIGEAALSGIPIVATEVGATAQVLTSVDDPDVRYGEVVPPNDPVSLARAQVSLLAMLGPWAQYCADPTPPPPLPINFTPADVVWISKRMHDKAADRRNLGLKLRDVVLRKFNGMRYLREHEQMYWAQRHLADQRANLRLNELATQHQKWGEDPIPKYHEVEDFHSMWREEPWQDFGIESENPPAQLGPKPLADHGQDVEAAAPKPRLRATSSYESALREMPQAHLAVQEQRNGSS